MLNFPIYWQLFLVPMVVVNAVAPLFLLQHVEAQIVLGAFLVSFAFMVYLTGRFGFTRILGLGHILWIPMLIFLYSALGNAPLNDRLSAVSSIHHDAMELWSHYVPRWTMCNHVRTTAAMMAALLYALGLLQNVAG